MPHPQKVALRNYAYLGDTVHKLCRLFPASDESGMLISLSNELSMLRTLRDALLGLKQRYQEQLQMLVNQHKLPESVEALSPQQHLALQHNSARMDAVNLLLDQCRQRWTDIFTADLAAAGAL